MGLLIAAAGAVWALVISEDAFEALVLPRRMIRRPRPTRVFYRLPWKTLGRRLAPGMGALERESS